MRTKTWTYTSYKFCRVYLKSLAAAGQDTSRTANIPLYAGLCTRKALKRGRPALLRPFLLLLLVLLELLELLAKEILVIRRPGRPRGRRRGRRRGRYAPEILEAFFARRTRYRAIVAVRAANGAPEHGPERTDNWEG
eukprot:scaffold7637_cov71-Phaeocystis_antarctica.AAC.1